MNIKRKVIDRVRITGKMSEVKEAHEWLWGRGYRCTRSGPLHLSGRKYNTGRFGITGEREMSTSKDGDA